MLVLSFLILLVATSSARVFGSKKLDITIKLDQECASNQNLNSQCAIYVFVDETSPESCSQEPTFFNVTDYILTQIPDGNSYGIRFFAGADNWCEYEFDNKQSVIYTGAEIVSEQVCYGHDPNIVYSDPLTYLLKLSSRFANVAVFLHGETDNIADTNAALPIAQQIGNTSNMLVYVWDHTSNGDQTGLFAALTGNQPGRIIRSSNDVASLTQAVQQQLIPDFSSIGCSSGPLPTTPPPPPPFPTTTVSTTPCSLLIFVAEASSVIGYEKGLMFLQLAQKIATAVHQNPNQRFALSLYATEVYFKIKPLTYSDFHRTVGDFVTDIKNGYFPNGAKTYLQPILDHLNSTLESGTFKNNAVLLMGELEAVKDIGKAYPIANTLGYAKASIYVLDESHGNVSPAFWQIMVGDKMNHVVSGKNATVDSLFKTFKNTLIPEFEGMTC